jgi:hypothetical protein
VGDKMGEPFHTDHCTHGHDCYVGSFTYGNPTPHERIDVYVYPDDYYGQEVCLRYGEEDYQYFSPTGISAFIRASVSMPLYQRALELLMEKGKIKFERNT